METQGNKNMHSDHANEYPSALTGSGMAGGHIRRRPMIRNSRLIDGTANTPGSFRARCRAWSRAATSMFLAALLACGVPLLPAPLSAAEKLSWKAGEKGTQGFWHQWPDKIYDGPIAFALKEVNSIPDGFTFRAYNVYADCAYKATRVSSRPNHTKPGDLDATRPMLFSRAFPLDKLPRMTLKGQQFHLPAEISAVGEDGSAFTAVFPFAGEDVTCKVQRTEYKVTKKPRPTSATCVTGRTFAKPSTSTRPSRTNLRHWSSRSTAAVGGRSTRACCRST